MTKNTARRKKRKNLKLRRTIRKTVAALIMIMAVIVAGLPVENLGTMRAQTASAVNISVQDLYEEYAKSMETTHKDEEDKLVEDGGVPDATDYSRDDSNEKYRINTICGTFSLRSYKLPVNQSLTASICNSKSSVFFIRIIP